MMKITCSIFWALFAGLLFSEASLAHTLSISNQTSQDIINICVTNPEKEFFLRLDLLPHASDTIENPEITANLRVDTGLELWSYKNIPLRDAQNLSFFQGETIYLLLTTTLGKKIHFEGTSTEMVPKPGSTPVCSLEKFHPAMTMKEVCAIFPDQMPRDDNGALLTGLGFAGLTWASRLIPSHNQQAGENSLLEHLELRRPLTLEDTEILLNHLFRQGYVPWQAEFPNKESEFENIPAKKSEHQILKQVQQFFAANLPAQHNAHSKGKKCLEASILMSPKDMLPHLETADEPENDVQIFTVILRPCTGVLLLDVAAYRKNDT